MSEGVSIEFKGFLFKVLGRHHEDLKVKGSPGERQDADRYHLVHGEV